MLLSWVSILDLALVQLAGVTGVSAGHLKTANWRILS